MSEQSKAVNQWSAKQHKFIDWLASPDVDRVPLSQQNWAKENGVHEATLSHWKRLPGFMDAVNELVHERLSHGARDAAEALKREAKAGSYAHLKMFFEMMGWYVEKSEQTVKGDLRQPLAIREIRVHEPRSRATDGDPVDD